MLEEQLKELSEALMKVNAERLGVGHRRLTQNQLDTIKEFVRQIAKTEETNPIQKCASVVAKHFRTLSKINTSGKMRACFLGMTTNGKSTTINALIGKHVAETRPNVWKMHTTQTLGRYDYNTDIEFLDTPGFGQIRGEFTKNEYFKSLTAQNSDIGFDLGVMVLRHGALDNESEVAKLLNMAKTPYIFVITHADIVRQESTDKQFAEYKQETIGELEASGIYGRGTYCKAVFFVSPVTGLGMDQLKADMEKLLNTAKLTRRTDVLKGYYETYSQELARIFAGERGGGLEEEFERSSLKFLKPINALSLKRGLIDYSFEEIRDLILKEFGFRYNHKELLMEYTEDPKLMTKLGYGIGLAAVVVTVGLAYPIYYIVRKKPSKRALESVFSAYMRSTRLAAQRKLKGLLDEYKETDLKAKEQLRGTRNEFCISRQVGKEARAGLLDRDVIFP